VSKASVRLWVWLDRRRPWYRWPRFLGLFMLGGLRDRLRERNLFDTGAAWPLPLSRHYRLLRRAPDGTRNDLGDVRMGSRRARFGRNVPLAATHPEHASAILDPSPRLISRKLLERREFVEAKTLNLLAAAWIQFEVHDWLSHTEEEGRWELPLADDDPWPEPPLTIHRTSSDPSSTGTGAPTYVSEDTHWWDGSQVYGSTPELALELRTGQDGKLVLDADELVPADLENRFDVSGGAGNRWIGLTLLNALFAKEHNAVCDALLEHEQRDPAGRTWTDESLFQTARLINAALMAKIHTVDWTPAVIAHPVTVRGMRAVWWGLIGEWFTRRFGRISRSDRISGVPGSPKDHFGVPYSLTEEFVAVYRMHPLIPDDFSFYSLDNGGPPTKLELRDVLGVSAPHELIKEHSIENVFYSFGRAYPGAIQLHNFPRGLQYYRRQRDHELTDLAATDILRMRERGVPRYNEFRELLGLKRVPSFEALAPHQPEWAKEMCEVYGGDIDRVDLMIGLFAEKPPKGFAFSDTAFRIFLVMASRRLKSDRFFTTDYTPRVYTRTGLDRIKNNGMRSVLLRHYPKLEPALPRKKNPFTPWNEVHARTGRSARPVTRRVVS
jgi:hypothetical protein